MPANPNVAFTTGAVLTAAQMNRVPVGVMGDASATATYTLTNAAADVTGMTVTFTARANRLYRASYYCGSAFNQTEGDSRSRVDIDLGGTVIQRAYCGALTYGYPLSMMTVFTTTAGSKTVKVRALYDVGAAGANLFADANTPMRLVVEDLGEYT
jgi:hypothetical protein